MRNRTSSPTSRVAPAFALAFALVFASIAGCKSSGGGGAGGGGGGGGSANDCFDYTGFDTMSPTVQFSADVLPIFRTSCGISSACHGCDESVDSNCTNSGYKPYLGPSMSDPDPSAAQLQAIFDQAVGQPAATQVSSVDGTTMVGDPDMEIVKAGDPAKSFMMYKLDGDPNATDMSSEVTCTTLTCASGSTCGLAMPSGGPQLSSEDRDTIRRWIAQGAKND
jgi:hypothetical protein